MLNADRDRGVLISFMDEPVAVVQINVSLYKLDVLLTQRIHKITSIIRDLMM